MARGRRVLATGGVLSTGGVLLGATLLTSPMAGTARAGEDAPHASAETARGWGADRRTVIEPAALYPQDGRRDLTGGDRARFPGAGVLWCRRSDGVPQKAAAAWLIGTPTLVMLNAHNFRNRQLETTRQVGDCYFQIGGRNYDFVAESLRLGVAPDATRLHITDDWALLRLVQPAEAPRQPVPETAPDLATGDLSLPVTLVAPGGHQNYRGDSSLEACTVRRIDPPTEGGTRRARHDCNDGYGGSGSGLFDAAGRLVAMQSASLSMNARHAFDIELHYGSALLIEGALLDALKRAQREDGAPQAR